MDWSDERYVRVYTRDTATWKLIGWEGRLVLTELLRKVDRAGVMDFGEEGPAGAIAAVGDIPLEIVEIGLPRLLERGSVVVQDQTIVLPKFLEAQEAKQSDKHRQRESRSKRRDLARHGVTKRDDYNINFGDDDVTNRDTDPVGAIATSVTKTVGSDSKPIGGDCKSIKTVTPSLAMPSLAMPSASQNKNQTRADARAGAGAGTSPDIERDETGAPIQPRRRSDLLNAPVSADDYEPMPEHEAYALGWGLTRSEYQATLDELVQKNQARSSRPAPPSRWDARLCGFIDAAVQSKTRTRTSQPKLSVVSPPVPAAPWVQPTTNNWDRNGPVYRALFLDDDDDEEPAPGKEA